MTWEQVKLLFQVADYARDHGPTYRDLLTAALNHLQGLDVTELHFAGDYDVERDSE